MNAVVPVIITTPDGVERPLRWANGAIKMIFDEFGCDLLQALKTSTSLPAVLHILMHDAAGNPPDITREYLAWNMDPQDTAEVLGSIMSAITQGKAPKKDIETLLKAEMKKEADALRKRSGLTPGPSARSVSESPASTSGGDISSAKLTPESGPTNASSETGESSSKTLQ